MRGLPELMLGAGLVAIGFATGGSVFHGSPSLLDACFDGLGLLFVGRGLLLLVRRAPGAASSGASVPNGEGLSPSRHDPGPERDIIG